MSAASRPFTGGHRKHPPRCSHAVTCCSIVSVCTPGVNPSTLKISCWKASIGTSLKLSICFTKAPSTKTLATPLQLSFWQPIQLTPVPVKVKMAREPATLACVARAFAPDPVDVAVSPFAGIGRRRHSGFGSSSSCWKRLPGVVTSNASTTILTPRRGVVFPARRRDRQRVVDTIGQPGCLEHHFLKLRRRENTCRRRWARLRPTVQWRCRSPGRDRFAR